MSERPSRPRKKTSRSSGPDRAVLTIAEQSRDAIRLRRSIRETFHDSKAITIKKGDDSRRG